MKTVCVIGDLHGHLQLALCMAARWQREAGREVFFSLREGMLQPDEPGYHPN